MRNFLGKIRLTISEKLALVLLIVSILSYWWASNHIWLPVNFHNVYVNGKPLYELDYSIFKSLSGDIYCYHQDHGKEYLVSLKKKEVTFSEDEDVYNYELMLYVPKAIPAPTNLNPRQIMPDSKLVIDSSFVEFTGVYGERWHIPY